MGMMLRLRWGSFFRLRWETFNSTGGILYSAGEHSYTLLRNIKTAGDTLILVGEYFYTPMGNIKTLFSADGRLTLLGESIADSFSVAGLS